MALTMPGRPDEKLYVGAVLDRYERNGYNDSDFYAIVWDGENARVIEYDTTRFAGGGSAQVDATDEVQAAARAWFIERAALLKIERAKSAVLVPEKGDTVRSLTKSGKNVGVEGVIRWVGPDQYSYAARFPKYGLPVPNRVGVSVKGEEKLRFMPEDSVERVEPREVDEAAIREQVARWGANANWRSLSGFGLAV